MLNKYLFWNIKAVEILAAFLFYFAFSALYHLALYINQGAFLDRGWLGIFDLADYWRSAGMQYALFMVGSFVLWVLIFRILKKKELFLRILVLLVLLPFVIYLIRTIHYSISDLMEWGRLRGTGMIWDLYIPGLFFFIQFGILFAYEHYRENKRKLILEGELRQAALKSELAAIKAQLNPHFLYNIFNTINASLPAENENTREMIARLSDLFRYQLQASQQELVPLKEELSFVKKYLELEKARFEDRLEINIDVAEDLMEEPIPPMLLQPLVENSVKHGLSSLIEGGIISISIFKEGEKLKFEISDTGVGIKDKRFIFEKGVGLNNTKLRLQKLYESQLELLDNSPRGLKVKFSI
ncbi:MAG: histidine kinase [Muriicola sp.]|nr:histidine kinase [Muriicola sp.]MBT8283408.1 histidine kinase [Muriicola sp.]NNK10312.1 histidine kinase [Flavobacteriaceae bacterium]